MCNNRILKNTNEHTQKITLSISDYKLLSELLFRYTV